MAEPDCCSSSRAAPVTRACRPSLVAAVLIVAATLTGCADGPAPTSQAAPPEAAPAWNPCTGLDIDTVAAEFGVTYATRLGSPDTPTCTFSPQTEGDPAIDINYQAYVGTLEELLKTFGVQVEKGRTSVASPTIDGADDARLITDVSTDDTLAITGFVQNGRLVQIVNVLDPGPFDRTALTAAARALMADLAANAGSSDLTG